MQSLEKTFRIIQNAMRPAEARVLSRSELREERERLMVSPFENPSHALDLWTRSVGDVKLIDADLARAAYFATFPGVD